MARKKFRTVNAFGKKKRVYHKRNTRKEDIPESSEGHSTTVEKRFQIFGDGEGDLKEFETCAADQFLLVSFEFLDNLVNMMRPCPDCSNPGKPYWSIKNRKGYAMEISIKVACCEKEIFKQYTSSQKKISEQSGKLHNHHHINSRIIFAANQNEMLQTKLVNFTNITGITGGIASDSYYSISRLILDKSRETTKTALASARNAVKRALGLSDEVSNIDVSFDGTWQFRGHKSKYGIGFCIEPTTGIVLDYHILSKYCRACTMMEKKMDSADFETWKTGRHKELCMKNFDGSSGMMETEAALVLWGRSEANGFRYTTLISDGDSSVHMRLKKLDPYKPIEIKKEECINHVNKRMVTQLNKVLSNEKARGHKMGGAGKVTQARIRKWSSYYHNAIVNSAPDAKLASKRVMAILKHNASTAINPMHDDCGEWCYYHKAKMDGKDDPIDVPPKNDKPLTEKMFLALKPAFERLSDESLLERCMKLMTQNANESLHSTVWGRCSKAKFNGKDYLECAVASAVMQWNQGATSVAEFAANMNMPLSPKFMETAKGKDRSRVKKAVNMPETSRARKRKRVSDLHEEERLIRQEGTSYGAGQY